MPGTTTDEVRSQIVALVREFVSRDVEPFASHYDREDIYPQDIADKMKDMGLFGITIPEEYGGLGLDHATCAVIFEELSKGWMSVTGIIGSHHMMSTIIVSHGTEEQKRRLLPGMATGAIRGGLALTEPDAGSDVQAIQTTAFKEDGQYVINGRKMFITNAVNGNAYAVIVKTDPGATPLYRGISCFIVQKPADGLAVGQKLEKLGYRGVDTGELVFSNCRVPAENLVGGKEGHGFGQLMRGLEVGRVQIAARAVGVASAAFDASVKYAKRRKTFGKPISEHQAIQLKLADMGTKIRAASLLTRDASVILDGGARADLEAGMAKLFATEVCQEVTLEALRIHGGYGYIKEYPVERYYRDAPLMIVGEGTNEIQRIIIARRFLEMYD